MAKLNRDELILKARELITVQPKAGRRQIAADMRREYGQSLRDATILSLQREIYPQPLSLVFKRKRSLEREGFTPKEAKELSTITFSHSPWFASVRRDRVKELKPILKDIPNKKLARKELKGIILDRYVEEGWVLEDGKLDPWQMFRDMRAAAIKSGDWKETPRRKGSRRSKVKRDDGGLIRIEKGQVAKQRARYQERQRAKKAISPTYLYGVKRSR